MSLLCFISTTWGKFVTASEINDLFDESPLEDRLWAEFKRAGVGAERQMFVRVKKRSYALDFAVPCVRGDLNVETDGDLWHSARAHIARDNMRDNDLSTEGWRILRFNSAQIVEELDSYCLPTVLANIERLGGVRSE